MRCNENAARHLIEAVRASGETIADYAGNHGISPGRPRQQSMGR
jgi:hypothetical protein